MSDGSRKVTAITEVTGLEGSQIVMQDIFAFRQTGVDAHGKVLGERRPTGAVPTWIDQLKGRGLHVDMKMFQEYSAGVRNGAGPHGAGDGFLV